MQYKLLFNTISTEKNGAVIFSKHTSIVSGKHFTFFLIMRQSTQIEKRTDVPETES